MSMKADAVAPANAAPVELSAGWDRSSDLSASEHAALNILGTRFATSQRQWPAGSRAALARLLSPLFAVLDRMHAARAPRNSTVHIVVAEMHRLNVAYWGWSGHQWLDLLCSSEAAFKDRCGGSSNCRQYVIAVAYLLCDFDRLAEIGRYFQYRLAIKVFGRDAVDHAVGIVFNEMTRVGLSAADRSDVSNALCMALLVQRSARLEDLTLNTLQHVAVSAAALRCPVNSGQSKLMRRAPWLIELPSEDGRREVADGAVATLAVVEDLDPLGDLGNGLSAGGEAPMVDEFVLQTAPEALHRGVVVAVAAT